MTIALCSCPLLAFADHKRICCATPELQHSPHLAFSGAAEVLSRLVRPAMGGTLPSPLPPDVSGYAVFDLSGCPPPRMLSGPVTRVCRAVGLSPCGTVPPWLTFLPKNGRSSASAGLANAEIARAAPAAAPATFLRVSSRAAAWIGATWRRAGVMREDLQEAKGRDAGSVLVMAAMMLS